MEDGAVFKQNINRRHTASEKWDQADKLFGGNDLLPLWVADMDFAVPKAVTQALTERVRHGVYGYTFRTETYLNAVRKWMSERHDWTVDTKWICHSPGVVTALNLIIDALTKPGDKLLIQPPVYPPFSKTAKNQQRDLVLNPLVYQNGRYHIDFDDLKNKLSDPAVKLMLLCSPHNPVGRVWEKQELLRIATLARENHVLVVADEIHSDLVLPGHRHLPFASIAPDDYWIVCMAPSKTFNLAGLQMSTIFIANPELREKYQKQLQRFSLAEPNTLGLTAAEAAFLHGSEWLDQCLVTIQRNAEYVSNYLKSECPSLVMTPLEGTYLAWIDCRRLGLSDSGLKRMLVEDAHLALNPGVTFGSEGSGFVRMNLACPLSTIRQAMNQLHKAVDQLHQRKAIRK
ncbi:MalY/PatB family protein [Sporolactobacillus spathodeae]|uniref:cysteine-S-conjugate beta-lyase n=1 Tax=Sporolactobacillus spathodeae TaxID=1465502 RepID=A0ABS2Q805_9BACL|nr:PatB family C-S lyase [Sporolactobacillus spathodeae]MBM7657907.1 cystathionine beta-lyase [Sporolactobacillus spathodeae]